MWLGHLQLKLAWEFSVKTKYNFPVTEKLYHWFLKPERVQSFISMKAKVQFWRPEYVIPPLLTIYELVLHRFLIFLNVYNSIFFK